MNPQILPSLPAPVRESLVAFTAKAQAALGAGLRALLLFGSGAEGRLRLTSDLNLLLLVDGNAPGDLDTLREPMRWLESAHRARFMVIRTSEWRAAMEAFPDKFLDIQRRNTLLAGMDPFEGRTLDPVHLRQQVSRALLNQVLRLREAYLLRSLREEQAAKALAEAAGPLRSEAAALCHLEGKQLAPKEALAEWGRRLPDGPWEEVLDALSRVREGQVLPPGTAPALLARVGRLAERLHQASL